MRAARGELAGEPALTTAEIERSQPSEVTASREERGSMHVGSPVVEPGFDELVPGRGGGIPGGRWVGDQEFVAAGFDGTPPSCPITCTNC